MTLDINRPDLTVGVVGTGAMGRGIAQVTAQGGIKAIMFDAAAGGAAKAKAAILDTLKGLVTKGRLTDADVAKTDANLGVAESLSDLKGCHVVVEAVFENLEVKQKLFGELEAVVAPDTILASNTSSIRIASIARALKHRDRVCGMHYFNPVPLMKLVEVIRAADTAQWVVAAMTALGQRQTRVPVVVGDTPGFLVNLGGTAIGTEGLRIMQEGRASPSQVDAVMRDSCGFRMGPFELMDLTGIDVNFPARKIIYEGFFHDRRMTPSPYHESLYAAGRLGRKTGGGWYSYDAKGAKIDPGADHGLRPRRPPASWSWIPTTPSSPACWRATASACWVPTTARARSWWRRSARTARRRRSSSSSIPSAPSRSTSPAIRPSASPS